MRSHGAALRICLAHERPRKSYTRRCQIGNQYLVAMVDSETGKTHSLLRLKVGATRSAVGTFVVLEHSGDSNSKPGPQCRAALRDLLQWCRSTEVSSHLARVRHQKRQYGNSGAARKRANRMRVLCEAVAAVTGDGALRALSETFTH